jgi:ABC-type Fe3+ transport system substrate-binding protein
MAPLTRRNLLFGAGACVAVAGLSACGSGGSGGSATATATGGGTLLSRAKAEGTLSYYEIGDTLSYFGPPFKQSYPWADVKTYQADGGTLSNKLITETQARIKNCDVIEVPPGQRANYMNSKCLATTPGSDLPNFSKLPPSVTDPEHYTIPAYQNPVVLVYNTSVIKEQLPKDIYEFAQPKWKGKLAMESPQALGLAASFLASQRSAWGDDKWMTWLHAMAANDILITPDSTSSYQAAVSGERPIAVDGINDITSQKPGVPVKALFYNRIAPLPVYLARTSLSPHPDLGALFINSVISTAGQLSIAKSGRIPIRSDINAPTAIQNVIPGGNAALVPLSDMKSLYEDPQSYIKIFNQLWPG